MLDLPGDILRLNLLVLVFLSWTAAAEDSKSCGDQGETSYLIWEIEGDWCKENVDCKQFMSVSFENLKNEGGPGEFLGLGPECAYKCKCEGEIPCWRGTGDACKFQRLSPATARDNLGPGLGRLFASMAKRPALRQAMSRSSGWHDAILALDASAGAPRVDVAAVFADTPPRPIVVRVCPVDPGDRCASRPRRIEWNGTTALLSGNDLKLGLYRLVEGQDASDAWIRFVAPDRQAEIQTEYRDAVETVKTWKLPEEFESAPALERLHRMFFVAAGED